jgi:hypothetical protein
MKARRPGFSGIVLLSACGLFTACDDRSYTGGAPSATSQPAAPVAVDGASSVTLAASRPAKPTAPATQPEHRASLDDPAYELRWASISKNAQREFQRSPTTYTLTLQGRLVYPEDVMVLAYASPEVLEIYGDDAPLDMRRSGYYSTRAYESYASYGRGLSEQSVNLSLSGNQPPPRRIDRIAGHIRLLVAKEKVTKDLDVTEMRGFVEVTPTLSVRLDKQDPRRPSSSQADPAADGAPRETTFVLKYRKPAGPSEGYSTSEMHRAPVVLDFTLLDDKGQELEARGTTNRSSLNAVNLGRLEGTLQATFLLKDGQTPKSVRLLYIPTTEEKKLGFAIENLEVP